MMLIACSRQLAVVAADLCCRPRDQRPPWFVIGFNAAQLMLAALAAHALNQLLHHYAGGGSPAQTVLDAIPAAKLRELVRGCIEQHIDQKNYEHLKIQEGSEREFLIKWTGLMRDGAA